MKYTASFYTKHSHCDACLIISQILKQQLKQKDEDIKNTSTDSSKDALIFRRRAELAEVAARSSRDKANNLEDVSLAELVVRWAMIASS